MKSIYLKTFALAFFVIFSSLKANGETKEFQHLIMYGQSLSIGYQAYPVISSENVKGNYMIGDQIWINYGNTKDLTDFQPLMGSIGNSYKNTENLMSRKGFVAAECPLLGTVNHLQMKMKDQLFLATSCGTSGRSIEELSLESETRNHYADYTYSLKSASLIARSKNYTVNCPAIFWMQGEWNYSNSGSGLSVGSKSTSDKDEYKNLLIKLKNNMQNGIVANYRQEKAPVFITYQAGGQYVKGRQIPIGMAQLETSNEYKDIVCAGPVYPMTDRGGHLDSNGYRWYGEMLGKVYYKTQVLGEDFRPLQPKMIERMDDPKKLKIQFLVPKPPLVLDTKTVHTTIDYGFAVYKDNVKQIISRVTIENDCVIINCSIPLEGEIEVVYAGETTAGHGNLRDSDDYEAFYTYEDLDKKTADGTSFVYPREESETTLRPNYEPKDDTGKVIYDKSYPLHNWSVAFYYKLKADENTYIVPNLDKGSNIESEQQENSPIFQLIGRNLHLFREKEKNIVVDIFDLSGKHISSNNVGNEFFSLENLPSNLYLVKATDGIRTQSDLVLLPVSK